MNVSSHPKCTRICVCNAKQQIEHHDEIMKVTQFLMGFNEHYTNIRGQLLMLSPVPKITKVLALLQQKERQRNSVNLAQPLIESAALLSKGVGNFGNQRNFKSGQFRIDAKKTEQRKHETRRSNMECSYCHGTNHIKDMCYHIIGFPPKPILPHNSSFRNSNFAYGKLIAQMSSTSNSEPQQLVQGDTEAKSTNITSQTKEVNINNCLSTTQYQQLLSLLNQY